VASKEPGTPAFGQADLSNCEREQIHLAGSIQPHGALLLVHESEYTIMQASTNAATVLNLKGEIVGRRLIDFDGDLFEQIQPHLTDKLHTLPVAIRCHVGQMDRAFDGLLHRPPDGGLVIELERAGPRIDLGSRIEKSLQTIRSMSSLSSLCDETARIFKKLTGYDRVMVYRFDNEGHGEVFSEQREPELDAYLGNRYPASDIPQMARRLYERNRVRVLVDVLYEPVELTPRLSPITGEELDMSLCGLRSMSPIHLQYLRNMGVTATLVASLVVGNKLWGLIACHHYVPRIVHFEVRAACELLAEAVAIRIAALESFLQGQAETSVRRLEQRLIEAISRDGDWRNVLFDSPQPLLQPLGASGVALLFEGQVQTAGEVPGTRELRELGVWLDGRQRAPVISTASLGTDEPAFTSLTAVASGVIAAPISHSPGDWLVWFRPERIRTVTWGGNPFKPVQVGNDPKSLSPRRSFSQWHQLVEGTSEPWTSADITAARLIGESLGDVVAQFRTVQVLIAQTQLDQVRRQVHRSEQPTIIADPVGHILLANEAFEQLRPSGPRPSHVEDLPPLFSDPAEVEQRLHHLLHGRRTWRGEVRINTLLGGGLPLMVRADPVFSTPENVLGYVLLFTDLTERKAADAARERFQDGIVAGHRVLDRPLDSRTDLVFQNLLAAVVENAQLAALEITDNVDTSRMAEMLEGVRISVERTTEVLQHLLRHATQNSKSTKSDQPML
jgi:chemotaxis family two-component system sensor kinase Cph1